ncbi:MAG: DUF3054 family protein [Acidimicrobiia bacterium]|nr:DUF3054 family protein [Acidimicrobiia bacterium]
MAQSTPRTAMIGDVAVLLLVTAAGFATHLTLDAFGRMIVTALSALLAWAAVAPFLDVYSERVITSPGAIWRIAWAWLLAAPLAAFLRAVALDRDIPWVFVLVTIVVNGLALVAWRVGLGWWLSRR